MASTGAAPATATGKRRRPAQAPIGERGRQHPPGRAAAKARYPEKLSPDGAATCWLKIRAGWYKEEAESLERKTGKGMQRRRDDQACGNQAGMQA